MNSSLRHASLAALALALVATPVLAKDGAKSDAASDKTIAVVNGKAIPASRANVLMGAQRAQGQQDTPELRNAVREELVRREILVQEAQKKGLDKKPEVQGQMELARQGVLVGAYLNDYVRARPIGEEAIKKEYEAIRSSLGDKEYKARHILLEKEDEAAAIIAKLKKGESFDELAKQSKDPGSKDRGGDLGWASPGSYVKPFAEAMAKLQKGKYTEAPVKSDFGFHVILLEDTRELKTPALDEVKAQISQRLQQKLVEQHIADIRGKAKIE